MKKMVVMITMALVTGLLAFGISRYWMQCCAAAPAATNLGDPATLASQLDLSPDQTKQLETLQQQWLTRLTECCNRHCAAKGRLETLLASASADPAESKQTIRLIAESQADADIASLELVTGIRALLTPDQLATFNRRMTVCLGHSAQARKTACLASMKSGLTNIAIHK